MYRCLRTKTQDKTNLENVKIDNLKSIFQIQKYHQILN